MAKVDNFKLIEGLLFDSLDSNVTTNSDKILTGRIIRRKKENPDKPSEYIVKRYTFASKEKFIEYQDEIKDLCHMYNARFYISTNVKSMKDIAFDISERVPNLIRNEQYFFFRRIFDDSADANKGIKKYRLFVFDIDNKDVIDEVISHLINLKKFIGNSMGVVHTLNGAHLLMTPHDTRYLHDDKVNLLPGGLRLNEVIDLKQNALTLVYYNKED